MADYSNSQKNNRSSYPTNAIDAQDADRLEPVVSPKQLRDRFLLGVKMTTDILDPETKRYQVITDELLKDFITRAVNEVEADTGVDIFPVQRSENAPFDRQTFQQWGYMRLEHSPILSIDRFSIRPTNGPAIYDIPLQWISTANFNKGQVNFVPLLPATAGNYSTSPAGVGGGAAFLQILSGFSWMPVFWDVQYTTGFYDGAVPRIINEMIGIYAAKEILSMLAASNTTNSRSLGLDGMSQSSSSPGPQRYMQRVKELAEKGEKLRKKVRSFYGRSWVMTNI